MSEVTENMKFCILWEDELRTASKLLHAAEECEDEDQQAALATQAYGACFVALYHLKDDHTLTMLASRDVVRRKPKKR